jgi:hypothetical protein
MLQPEINSRPEEAEMEEMHRTHKDTAWGWVAALEDWRRSRTRRRLRRNPRVVTPWSARSPANWSA